MDTGYIKIWRKIKDWQWCKDLKTLGFFLYLMLEANYKDSKYMGYDIPRGALVCGRKALSKQLNLSERSVRTLLTRLKTTSEIAIKTTNRFSIVYILNYNKYQEKTTNETTIQPSDDRPTNDQQPTTSKEGKKVRSKEIKNKEVGASAQSNHLEFIGSLKQNGAYKHISIDTELLKMDAWLSAHRGRKKSKRFVLNWLNKIEAPIPSEDVPESLRRFIK